MAIKEINRPVVLINSDFDYDSDVAACTAATTLSRSLHVGLYIAQRLHV